MGNKRVRGPEFDHYDEVGQVAGLAIECVFCRVVSMDQDQVQDQVEMKVKAPSPVLYRDAYCLILPDKRQDRV